MSDPTYAAGTKHRVANVMGLRLRGMAPISGGFQGWARPLNAGDVLTCGGFVRGWGSDPGPDIVTWTHLNDDPLTEACFIEVSHSRGGFWETRPNPQYLEPMA